MRRRPLVRIAGQDVQLPEGDSIDPGLVLLRTKVATATATEQTIFEVEYHVGMIAVTLDGALLPPADYTAEDGERIVLGSGDGVAVGSMLTVLVFSSFAVADALPVGGTAVNSARLGGELPAAFLRKTDPLAGYRELLDSSSATALDVSAANVFKRVLTAPTTFTFTGAVANRNCSFTLYLEAGGSFLPTFPASVKWIGGSPVLTAKDRLVFDTIDAGATWLGTYAGSYA